MSPQWVRAESWWGPGAKPLEALKTLYHKGSKISLSIDFPLQSLGIMKF